MRSGGGVSSGWVVQSALVPARRRAVLVRHASAPVSRATSSSPRPMSRAVTFTSDCGELPPRVVTAVCRGEIARRSATRAAGSG